MTRFVRAARRIAFAAIAVAFGSASAFAQAIPLEIPFVNEWAASAHARSGAKAFNYWNETGTIPEACARCHSTAGFRDYLGVDGSTPGKVDRSHLTGSVVACVACHNPATAKLTSVTFPSGKTVENLGKEAVCMTCHQGRESSDSVEKAIAGIAIDTPDAKLRFINIHYREAAAVRYGTQARGGYEYPGKTYAGYFLHHKDSQTCRDCHESHTTRVVPETCAGSACHASVKARADFASIRRGPKEDYDGNGNFEEGISKEVDALHGKLLTAIRGYAQDVLKKPIGYDPHTHPYFFIDKNNDGKIDEDEAKGANAYAPWTPRLLKAAYNYQFVAKDPGAFTHNPPYVIQLMHDSLTELGEKTKVNLAGMTRP
jgi:hypothetical protein